MYINTVRRQIIEQNSPDADSSVSTSSRRANRRINRLISRRKRWGFFLQCGNANCYSVLVGFLNRVVSFVIKSVSSRMKWNVSRLNRSLFLNYGSDQFWGPSSHHFLFLISSLLLVFLSWVRLAREMGNTKFIKLFSSSGIRFAEDVRLWFTATSNALLRHLLVSKTTSAAILLLISCQASTRLNTKTPVV